MWKCSTTSRKEMSVRRKVEELSNILKCLRVGVITDEYILQNQIADLLHTNNISHTKEYKLGRGSRVDFLTDNGIAIEVKKGKPNKLKVYEQLMRYAEFEEINGIILIIETSLQIPNIINGKPCQTIGLRKQWGIAL